MTEQGAEASTYSAILNATIRAAGDVPVRIDAHHLGTPQQAVGVTLGSVLVYVGAVWTVSAITEGWRAAAPIAEALGPARPMVHHRAGLVDVAGMQVGMVVRLNGVPTVSALPVPRRPGSTVPAHARIQVGPLVWQVCDWNAYAALSGAWVRAEKVLRVAGSG